VILAVGDRMRMSVELIEQIRDRAFVIVRVREIRRDADIDGLKILVLELDNRGSTESDKGDYVD
jgi:hypothetical protein